MTSIITGNIADFPEQLKSILEKTVKYERFITIRDNSDEKQLTISISAAISTAIANGIDIYNVVRDGILYLYIFHVVKRCKKNIDSRDHEQAPTTDKELVINYKDAVSYNITIASKGVANISKNLKKHKLEMITRIDESHTLYKFMNKYILMIDSNGVLFYYPDSIAITPLKSWVELSASKNNLALLLDDTITLDKYLLLNKFVSLECNLDTDAYGLYDVLGYSSLSGNVAITSSTDIQKQNTLELEKCDQPPTDSNNTNTNASYSALGYILSWLNPLSYYNSNTNNSSNTSNSSNTTSSISTNQDNKTIPISNINKNIDDDINKNIDDDINKNINKNIDDDIDNDINKQNTSYFLDTSSKTYNLIKIQDKKVKILKAHQIEIPAFITDITIDNVDNIIISGRIDNQPINMKYNKYMIGMHLV